MLLTTNLSILATLFLFVHALSMTSIASTTSYTFSQSKASNLPQQKSLKDSCEIRHANYITSTLPQQCLKNASNASTATRVDHIPGLAEAKENVAQFITVVGSNITSSAIKEVIQEFLTNTATEAEQTQEPVPGLAEDQSVFLSFEEWKKQTLEKAEQKEHNNGQRKLADSRNREFESFQKNKDHSADDGTIEMQSSTPKSAAKKTETGQEKTNSNEPKVLHIEEKRESYRSKDAGKTCKERLSYASFDAGATVLKTHPGAKNAKNVLTENKDSYMLTECSVENKFLIIELSEDIWIDTVVLANYEFFSSMIRTFRISVSDRFPVKTEKWKEVGTFEARNSREIQAFLIENPQIWARYIRFEFLDHYGTEYYCPLSLVRVHGTRMLESWKETEAAGEDEDAEEDLSFEEANGVIEETVTEVTNKEETTEVDHDRAVEASSNKAFTQYISDPVSGKRSSRRDPGYYIFEAGQPLPPEPVCFPNEVNSKNVVLEIIKTITVNSSIEFMPTRISSSLTESDNELTFSTIKGSEKNTVPSVGPDLVSPSKVFDTDTQITSSSDISQFSHSSQGKPSSVASENSHDKNISKTPTISKNKNSTQTMSSSSSLPTIQESFFKSVSRRLTLLESNSTLSLAYISEATSHLHQAFAALSRNITRAQLNKTTVFLDAINDTVLSEFRGFRQQFDEIWKSTVISLESQKDESRRETLAVSERLNILAQEVVWQRRMSIVQSILLILCLGIVIFSRVSTNSENLYTRPRSSASTFSRYYHGRSLSEPGTPAPWPEANYTPNRTPIWSRNYSQNSNIVQTHETPQKTHPTHIYEPMSYNLTRSPITGYFDQISISSPAFADRDFNPSEEIPSYQSRTRYSTLTPPSLTINGKLRRSKSSPLVPASFESPETCDNYHETSSTDFRTEIEKKLTLHLLKGYDHQERSVNRTSPSWRESLLRRRNLQLNIDKNEPTTSHEESNNPPRTSTVLKYFYTLAGSVSNSPASSSFFNAKKQTQTNINLIYSPSTEKLKNESINVKNKETYQDQPPENSMTEDAVITGKNTARKPQIINHSKPLPALPDKLL
ncbi:hypothetical protein Golomagni_00647 [Golovinomyces magnicellulatus]|nr:hypothetical protein Golomagni_00647 [Golovinomyces magnicellulatus]